MGNINQNLEMCISIESIRKEEVIPFPCICNLAINAPINLCIGDGRTENKSLLVAKFLCIM